MSAPEVTDEEFRSVGDGTPEDRYDYFVRRVVEWDAVYVLHGDDGIATVRTEDAGDAMPLWPHERFAVDSAGGFAGYEPVVQSLDWLVDELLPGLTDDGVEVIVLYMPDRLSRRVPARELLDDIEAARSPDADDELYDRYDRWVAAAREAGRVWILSDDEHNTVIEDEHEDRDLHLLFTSRADAEQHVEGATRPEALELGALATMLDRLEERGEGVALWDGDSWIVADGGPLGDDLRASG